MPKRERADGHRRPAIRGRSFSQRNVRSHRKNWSMWENAAQRAGARIANAAPLEEAAEHYRRYMAETSRDGSDCSPPNGVGIAWERHRRINSLDRIHRVNPGLGEDRVGVASS